MTGSIAAGAGDEGALVATVAALLAPIPGADPGGRNLRYEGDYDRIGEARRDENARLPQGVWVRDVKQADWGLVERLCIGALRLRSKDLRLACWLSEAWVYRHGFGGLAAAMTLIDGLCRDHWDRLHPRVADDGPGAQIAAIEWLNQRLPVVLRQVPLVIDALRPGTRFTWSDHVEAQRLDGVRRQDMVAAQRAEAAGGVTLAAFEACLAQTDSAILAATAANLDTALVGLAELDATLNARLERDAPGLGRIRRVADDIADFARSAVAARQDIALVALPAPTAPQPPAADKVAASVPAAPTSRALAYRQLAAVADFLRDSEPHSPVPYVLDYLIEWAKLPLPDLDFALRNGGSSMTDLLQALGLNVNSDEYEGDG